jgi:hypothetical protein
MRIRFQPSPNAFTRRRAGAAACAALLALPCVASATPSGRSAADVTVEERSVDLDEVQSRADAARAERRGELQRRVLPEQAPAPAARRSAGAARFDGRNGLLAMPAD